MRQRIRAVIAIGAMILLVPLPSRAADPITISGHTFNVFGEPISACVRAFGPAKTAAVEPFPAYPKHYTTLSAADGFYSFTVLPGDYDVIITRATDSAAQCGSYSARPNAATHVFTVTQASDVDLTLPARLDASASGDLCCLASATSAGGSLHLYANTDREAADRGAIITWHDDDFGSGSTITLTQPGTFPGRYQGIFSVPASTLDGTHFGTFSITDSAGRKIADDVTVTSIIDSIAPVIVETYPAEGDTDIQPGDFFPWVRATDVGTGGYGGQMQIFDVTAHGQHDWIKPSVGGTLLYRTNGPEHFSLEVSLTLIPGHNYQSEISIKDYANNTTERVVHFTATSAPRFFGQSPTEAFPARSTSTPISICMGRHIDLTTVKMYVRGIDPSVGLSIDYRHRSNAETGCASMTPGEPFGPPPLVNGRYRATVYGNDIGGFQHSFAWEFTVDLAT